MDLSNQNDKQTNKQTKKNKTKKKNLKQHITFLDVLSESSLLSNAPQHPKGHYFLDGYWILPFFFLVWATCTLSMAHWWNNMDGEKPKYLEKNLSQCHFHPLQISQALTWDQTCANGIWGP
jgi:hypothetical protein